MHIIVRGSPLFLINQVTQPEWGSTCFVPFGWATEIKLMVHLKRRRIVIFNLFPLRTLPQFVKPFIFDTIRLFKVQIYECFRLQH